MSRRIRSLKPEIIEDEKIGPLSDAAFRLFTSMITIADDYGNVRADIRWLQAQIWWAHKEPPNVLPALLELVRGELIEVYGVRGGTYAHLRGWEKHQRVDNAGKGKVPNPKDPDALVFNPEQGDLPEGQRRLAETRGEPPRDSAGWDGMGEEGMGVSGKPDLVALSFSLTAVTEINRLAGTAFRHDCKSALDMAKTLTKAKHTEADALAVIQSKRDWLSKPDMREHFCPATLLGSKNFQRYLDNLRGRVDKQQLSLVGNSSAPETMFVGGKEYVVG